MKLNEYILIQKRKNRKRDHKSHDSTYSFAVGEHMKLNDFSFVQTLANNMLFL